MKTYTLSDYPLALGMALQLTEERKKKRQRIRAFFGLHPKLQRRIIGRKTPLKTF